jgi:hypothetical protein
MSEAVHKAMRPTPLPDLLRDLRMFISLDGQRNDAAEHFIASCDPKKVDVESLKQALCGCREATDRLAELYRLLEALVPYEDVLRALAEKSLKSGRAAAA